MIGDERKPWTGLHHTVQEQLGAPSWSTTELPNNRAFLDDHRK
jgi:hypothetical protein